MNSTVRTECHAKLLPLIINIRIKMNIHGNIHSNNIALAPTINKTEHKRECQQDRKKIHKNITFSPNI